MGERVYRLVGREPTGLELGGRRLSPFVGRERELALLWQRLDQVAGGRGHVVGLVGEPGVGKSRLLYEFRERLGPGAPASLEARCLSYGGASPYLPLADLLRREWGLGEGQAAAGETVRRCVAEAGLPPDESVPYVLSLLGLPEGAAALATLSPEAVKRRTFEALRQLILGRSRQGPLVFTLEDLHWVDRTSEEFFTTLVDALGGAAVLFVCTYRPGYRPSWIERSYVSQLALPPLSADESTVVVRAILPSRAASDEVAQAIVSRAEGNPFFLEELAWAMGRAAGPGADGVVPATVHDALLARMGRLPAGAQRLVETAAVLGREVAVRVLERIWPGPEGVVDLLRTLVREEFLHEQLGGVGPVYQFKHALTQEVAYARLAAAERRRLHAAAGRAVEALHAGRLDEVLDQLAHHFSRADEHTKAVEFLTRVADRATAAYALPEAMAALTHGLEHAERLPRGETREAQVLRVVARHGLPMILLGRLLEARNLLLRYRERVERLNRAEASGPYYAWLALTHDHTGDPDVAIPYALRAMSEAGRADDHAARVWASAALAFSRFWLGQFRQSVGHAEEAIASLSAIPDSLASGMLHYISGWSLVRLSQFEQALRIAAEVRRIGEATGDRRLQSYGISMRGWVAALRGDTTAAVGDGERAVELAPDPLALAVDLMFLGETYVAAQEPSRARAVLERAERLLAGFQFPSRSWVLCHLSEAERQTGLGDRAHQLASEALSLAPREKFPLGRAMALRALGRTAQAVGALDEAARHFDDALGIFAAIEARYELARTGLDRAGVARGQGRREAARQSLAEARRVFEALDVPYWAEHAVRLAQNWGLPCP